MNGSHEISMKWLSFFFMFFRRPFRHWLEQR